MKLIDLHCDTMLSCYFGRKPLQALEGHINIEKLREGDCLAQCFALFIVTNKGQITGPDGKTAWDTYEGMLRCFRENLAASADFFRPARTAAEIRQNAAGGFRSAILTVEDGIAVDGQHERIDRMAADGVKMLALTWNYENCFGFPNSPDPTLHAKGLKPFGLEAVEQMNRLGMIIDVSHLSEGGFRDVAAVTKKPFVASHSCARALRDHPRNLTDEQLRMLADRGGVVGVNFCSDFLSEDRLNTYSKDIVRHLVHFRNVAGIDALAWGSDFDGIESKLDFQDYAGFPKILELLSGEFTESEIEKICSRNFLRVLEDNSAD